MTPSMLCTSKAYFQSIFFLVFLSFFSLRLILAAFDSGVLFALERVRKSLLVYLSTARSAVAAELREPNQTTRKEKLKNKTHQTQS